MGLARPLPLAAAADEAAKAGGKIIDAFRKGFDDNSKLDDALDVVSTSKSSSERSTNA